ncbi:MAG: phosphatidylglycerol lysyltransferase domain-containing protein [Lachnospiraceae bacterium]|nr:phosphatidylglycerol lysyltransferase domain-containing protein [Lachnospiraceae bacterium]
MIEFKNVELTDREWIEPLLAASGFQGCDYTFGNLYIWKDLYRQQVAKIGDMLCAKSRKPGTGEYLYLFPAGTGNLREAVEYMRRDAEKQGVPFLLRGFGKAEADRLSAEFPDTFIIESVRAEWDYLYRVEDLALLAGKKYHGKRNHIARFEDSGEWRFEPLTAANIEAGRTMCEVWYTEHAVNGNTAALIDRGVVNNALCEFDRLGFTGGVLYQYGQVVGFTIGEPLNADTYAVHVEKAFAEINGAYPMINREYVKHMMQNFTYVNREEDDGLEGLRKAKESYYPIMLEKFVARER